MSCPRAHLIVRLVGGELANAEERDVRQHLATCASCRAAYEDLRETWDDLGVWEVDPTGIDLSDRVLARAKEQENPISYPLLIAVFRAGHLRAAASIAFAAGLGITTGALVPRDRAMEGPQSSAVPTAVELVEALGLAELATQSATGLSLGFEPETPEGAEVEPS